MKFNNKSKEQNSSNKMAKVRKKFKWKKFILWMVILVIIVIGSKFAINRALASLNKEKVETTVKSAKVETRDIQNVLSSSGTVQPLNTYTVTTLVEGEVISADFEEGDQVEEGDVLYQITTDDLDTKIETAETAVTRAEKNYKKSVESYDKSAESYNEALADYKEASSEYSDLNIESTASGMVKTLYVEVGDTVQDGAQIAEVYDNSSMLLEIPFNAAEVDTNLIGKTANVEIVGSFELVKGVVTKVSKIEDVLSGNQIVKTVTIRVTNPGGLTITNTATASIGDIYSSSEGTFKVLEQTIIKADKSGEISSLKMEEGSSITSGDIIIVLDSDVIENQLETYKKSLENAEASRDNAKESVENADESVEDAKTNLEDIIDTKTDYSITAPISGQIIRKNTLVGDTISNANTTLCIIYDLSAVTFEMAVDELDVMNVAVGQEVNITADALDGVAINGIVTNVSLESTTSSGVTQYPVTVKISDIGNLLPGMNVTGEIVIEKVEGVVAIPSDALMRGDVVYVADSSVLEAVGDVPAGFKEVEVETGLTDGDYVEIISGLKGDEEVYVARTTTSTEMQAMQGGMMFGTSGSERPSGTRGGQMPSGGGGPQK